MKLALEVKELLEESRMPYEVILHPKRLTALETAEAEHVSGHTVAKVVMVKAGSRDLMAVIPADRKLSLYKLGTEVGTYDLRIEREDEFRGFFPDCELGGMPPLGPLYHLPCYVDAALLDDRFIVFNAGSHEASIRMAVKDYVILAQAIVGDYSLG